MISFRWEWSGERIQQSESLPEGNNYKEQILGKLHIMIKLTFFITLEFFQIVAILKYCSKLQFVDN